MRGHGNSTRREPIRGCRGGHSSGGVNITTTAERNVVATDVGGIRDEALTRRYDLRLICRKSPPSLTRDLMAGWASAAFSARV